MDGQIGQHLAVQFDAGTVKAVHELGVGEAVEARAGIDALNPKGAEIAFAVAAVAVLVLHGPLEPLFGDAKAALGAAAKAFGFGNDFLVAGAAGDFTLGTGHGYFLLE